MPVLFVGHGSPMNALTKNKWTNVLENLAKTIAKPKAILCVSAHWMTRGTRILDVERPKTIHDFGNFPQELFEIEYPASGSPVFANQAWELLRPFKAQMDTQWGFDHGTWSVLLHMYPNADVPVFQVSLDQGLNEKAHMEIGKALRSLREEGVLILGSGNIVHNLRKLNWQNPAAEAFSWAIGFDAKIKEALEKRDEDVLLFHKLKLGEESNLSVPTDEHYWPLLYSYGASERDDRISFPHEGFEMGSLSMRTVMWS
jgi:4,5-DOPA dioxygenase extradiol